MADGTFRYELEEWKDEQDWLTTRIKCHGRLVNQTTDEIKGLVKPLIERGGRIILDFGDLEYMDSSGLGAIVGLKVSAIHRGLCKLELENLSGRVKDLLSLANLKELFAK